MKRYLFIIVGLLFLVGCSTKEENEKYAYLEYKNDRNRYIEEILKNGGWL